MRIIANIIPQKKNQTRKEWWENEHVEGCYKSMLCSDEVGRSGSKKGKKKN